MRLQTNKQRYKMNTLTTIEQMIETINCLASIAEDALDLVDEYSGDESGTADELRAMLRRVMDEHNA
jgi:hypothetical protein